ncbi:MAG TPA: protein translocase subunit SecD [Acetobacteraceae bacterium]|nr:protein translocase subunit SecD [Acetobacteraceae bacterium]
MMYFSPAKARAIYAVCLLGALLCLPNIMARPVPWLPWRQVHLGLDLRGGSYLLMEVDMGSVVRERLDSLADATRQALFGASIGYQHLAADPAQNRVTFRLRDPAQRDAALAALRAIPPIIPGEFSVDTLPDDGIALTLSEAALRQRANSAVQQSIEIVRRRIDQTGVVDPQIARQGDSRIVVQLPGIEDPNRIKELLGKTARMTFRLVDDTVPPGGPAPAGDEVLPMQDNPEQKIVVRRHVEVDGADLTDAQPGQTQDGRWAVRFAFDTAGTRRFAEVTTANVGRPFAVVLDNKVITAPRINEPITGGTGEITGNFNAQSATDLAVLLRAGALPAPLTVVEQRSVGPELGADSIRAGALALGLGFVLVIAFMATFYGLFGWYANVALLANLVLMVAILSLFEATLTLPGMAGILLTLGMAVDANILVNERIREEVKAGRTPLNALDAGFRRAYGTILDSNVTALLAHVTLFVFGTGPVRGFALTITVGIVTTLFTATVLARLLMVRWYAARRPALLPV